jgi:lipoate-protein ligase A
VLLEPGASLWVDVVVPREDRLWSDDVGVAFSWLGQAWARALDALGVATEVHEGALVTTRWSRLVCFAGLGPGELTSGGAKVVGIAQRRSRGGARFQCCVLHRWDAAATLALLALTAAERAEAEADLAGAAAGIDLPPDELVAALVAELPG